MTRLAKSFRPNPRLLRWLRSGGGEGEGPDWDGWLLRRMSEGEIVTVGGVFVDRQVLRQRFACVSERCAPAAGRGRWRSCCADVDVVLDESERRRARSAATALEIAGCERAGCLARPGGRCVFSGIDDQARIRCRLRRLARQEGVDRSEFQPLSCRLFPLIVVDFGGGRIALSVVSRGTHRLVGAFAPSRYPCLADPALPPLWRALSPDIDWAFGRGFARALGAAASETGGRPPGDG